MRVMGIRVVAVDAGPAGPPSTFAWAGFDAPARESCGSGDDPLAAVSALVAGLAWGRQAALLLLGPPLPVPGPAGEPAAGAWVLRRLAEAVPGLSATTQAGPWQARAARLLLAGTPAPGRGKSGREAAVAAAGLALAELLGTAEPLAAQVRSPHGSFNLLAALALWAGLSIDPLELSQDVLVIAPRSEPGH